MDTHELRSGGTSPHNRRPGVPGLLPAEPLPQSHGEHSAILGSGRPWAIYLYSNTPFKSSVWEMGVPSLMEVARNWEARAPHQIAFPVPPGILGV